MTVLRRGQRRAGGIYARTSFLAPPSSSHDIRQQTATLFSVARLLPILNLLTFVFVRLSMLLYEGPRFRIGKDLLFSDLCNKPLYWSRSSAQMPFRLRYHRRHRYPGDGLCASEKAFPAPVMIELPDLAGQTKFTRKFNRALRPTRKGPVTSEPVALSASFR